MTFTEFDDATTDQMIDKKKVKEPKFDLFNFKKYIENQIESNKGKSVFRSSLRQLDKSTSSCIGATKKYA